MPVDLFRIDDRLIHGQVVVGWGQPLDLAFIVLVDDTVASSEWEQELYRMGVPPEITLEFLTVEQAAGAITSLNARREHGMVLTATIDTMRQLVERSPAIRSVNVGGIHHRAGRTARLRYVFLTPDEEQGLRVLAALGATVTAQDVPATSPVPLDAILQGTGCSSHSLR